MREELECESEGRLLAASLPARLPGESLSGESPCESVAWLPGESPCESAESRVAQEEVAVVATRSRSSEWASR